MHPPSLQIREDTRWLAERARAVGFELCGVVAAGDFPELGRLPEWLARGYAGEMNYLNDPRRLSPERMLDGAKSLIVCGLNYNTALPFSTEAVAATAGEESENPRGWISRYAWGDDYHDVLLAKLQSLAAALRERFTGEFTARAYVDTGPILERVVAKHAGLGWQAKNTCLINEEIGSMFFLGIIITSLELAPSLAPAEAPPPDLCGNCSLCIDACPTDAIVEPYVLDARRCIAYLTIELRGSIPSEFREPVGHHVFGCDICQDVCPWNRKAPAASLAAFQPRSAQAGGPGHATEQSLFSPDLLWLAALSEEEHREVFRGSPIKRTKRRGLVRNACVALGNSGLLPGAASYSRVTKLLEDLSKSEDPVVPEHAAWALHRLQSHAGCTPLRAEIE
jgi:epoxyqueuosine reductase